MGKKCIIEGVVKIDSSKPNYDGRVSVYRNGALLGILDPIKPEKLKALEKADGKKIRFKPELVERTDSEIKFYASNFSLE